MEYQLAQLGLGQWVERDRATGLSTRTSERLLAYQRGHTETLGCILEERRIAFDLSPPGTGKTYCAAALCYDLAVKPVIVCPKSSMFTWRRICAQFEVEPLAIVNYETLCDGKVYTDELLTRRRRVDWLQVRGTGMDRYQWSMDAGHLIIFDEAHYCRNSATDNGALLIGASKSEAFVLCLSATLSEAKEDFKTLLYLIGHIGGPSEYRRVVRSWEPNVAARFRRLFQPWCSRMKWEEAVRDLPPNNCTAEEFACHDRDAL